MDKKSVAKNYRFLAILLSCMVAGALLGWFRPKWGHNIAFLGTVFINMMFCVVVPLVFASIAGSVANMESRQRAGKIMGVTDGTFVITGAIAAVLMFVLMKLFPPVLTPWADMVAEEIGEHASFTEMIVNFFTSSDFVGLLSRHRVLYPVRLLRPDDRRQGFQHRQVAGRPFRRDDEVRPDHHLLCPYRVLRHLR